MEQRAWSVGVEKGCWERGTGEEGHGMREEKARGPWEGSLSPCWALPSPQRGLSECPSLSQQWSPALKLTNVSEPRKLTALPASKLSW